MRRFCGDNGKDPDAEVEEVDKYEGHDVFHAYGCSCEDSDGEKSTALFASLSSRLHSHVKVLDGRNTSAC